VNTASARFNANTEYERNTEMSQRKKPASQVRCIYYVVVHDRSLSLIDAECRSCFVWLSR